MRTPDPYAAAASEQLAAAAGLDAAIAAEAADRVLRPDFPAWTRQVDRCGHCARPVRLRGHVADSDGRPVFTTGTAPDRVLLVRCRNRRGAVCPGCSAEYKGDVWHLLAAGTAGGDKGVPVTVGAHPMVFATLTAPSFGPVHAAGRCHPGDASLCRHGARCGRTHAADDPVVGEPVCGDCYDYTGAVVFNWHAPELWRRFVIALRRALAARAGMSERTFAGIGRVSFAKVAEFQRRGVVRFHAVIRLDGAGEDYAPPPADLTAADVAAAVLSAASSVSLAAPIGLGSTVELGFGAQVDVRPVVTGAELSPEMVAAYIAKYATKAAEDFGLPERLTTPGDPRLDLVRPHVRRMVQAAASLQSVEECRGIARWLHMLGFRGHFATKSRRFSTTLGALRAARRLWRASRDRNGRDGVDETPEVVGMWRFAGLGHTSRGDAVLAAASAAHAREQREARAFALQVAA